MDAMTISAQHVAFRNFFQYRFNAVLREIVHFPFLSNRNTMMKLKRGAIRETTFNALNLMSVYNGQKAFVSGLHVLLPFFWVFVWHSRNYPRDFYLRNIFLCTGSSL